MAVGIVAWFLIMSALCAGQAVWKDEKPVGRLMQLISAGWCAYAGYWVYMHLLA